MIKKFLGGMFSIKKYDIGFIIELYNIRNNTFLELSLLNLVSSHVQDIKPKYAEVLDSATANILINLTKIVKDPGKLISEVRYCLLSAGYIEKNPNTVSLWQLGILKEHLKNPLLVQVSDVDCVDAYYRIFNSLTNKTTCRVFVNEATIENNGRYSERAYITPGSIFRERFSFCKESVESKMEELCFYSITIEELK